MAFNLTLISVKSGNFDVTTRTHTIEGDENDCTIWLREFLKSHNIQPIVVDGDLSSQKINQRIQLMMQIAETLSNDTVFVKPKLTNAHEVVTFNEESLKTDAADYFAYSKAYFDRTYGCYPTN